MTNDFEACLLLNIDQNCSLERVSESSVIIRVATVNSNNASSLQTRNAVVKKWLTVIKKNMPSWLIDYVIAYDSLLIEFDTMQIEYDGLIRWLKALDVEFPDTLLSNEIIDNVRLHKIEVCYVYSAKNHPNDMSLVEQQTGLSFSEIIQLHQSINYQVFAIGFMPHFAYLGELPSAISVPRLKAPRLKVPAGAVAITDNQTAVYPNESPGGWHIIGYTNFIFGDGAKDVIGPNDKVIFKAIDEKTFLAGRKRISEGYA